MKKIVIVTDTWTPDINGVVTSIVHQKEQLESRGFAVRVIHPREFHTIPIPFYPEMRLALVSRRKLGKILSDEHPDYVHIATEGTLGLVARMYCVKRCWKFTTFFHTKLPEYIALRLKIRGFNWLITKYLKWFHNAAECTMVSAASLRDELERKGFENVGIVPLGVDIHLFTRNSHAVLPKELTRPVFVYLGRVAPEKNLEAFLRCNLPGSKLIIGDGPQRESLEKEFSGSAVFVGYKRGREVVDLLSVSDVFVFPSKTDTLGLVLLEALACDLPVAAFNVPGPSDIIVNGVNGYLGDNLEAQAMNCLKLSRENCRKTALKYSWEKAINEFLKNLTPVTF